MKKQTPPLCKISFDGITIDQAIELPFENKFKSEIIKSIARKIKVSADDPDDYVAGWILVMKPEDLNLVKRPYEFKVENLEAKDLEAAITTGPYSTLKHKNYKRQIKK